MKKMTAPVYYVEKSVNGVNIDYQAFRTKAEAEKFAIANKRDEKVIGHRKVDYRVFRYAKQRRKRRKRSVR